VGGGGGGGGGGWQVGVGGIPVNRGLMKSYSPA